MNTLMVVALTLALAHPPQCPAPVPDTVKVCVPVPDVKKTTKVVYSCKTEEYCVPMPDCLTWLFSKCGLACEACKGPYTKRVLVKRFVTEEVPVTKCEVKEIGCPK